MRPRVRRATIFPSLSLLLIAALWERSVCLAFESVEISHRPNRRRPCGRIGKRGRFLGFDEEKATASVASRLRSSAAMDVNDDSTADAIGSSLESALRFARTDPDAVVLSLWPSAIRAGGDGSEGRSQVDVARSYLERSGAKILHESSAEVPAAASTLLVMAAYWGEDWLRTNCWYGEQPLEELGLARPSGSWPGAKWKRELCFRQETEGAAAGMHVFVASVGAGGRRRRLWSEKYSVRAGMARDTGHAGNSCMHLTDDQSEMIGGGGAGIGGGGGTDCNASYAFACARCLLNPLAMEYLARCATERFPADDDLQGGEFLESFGGFCGWLGDRSFEDVVVAEGTDENGVGSAKSWNRPPAW